MVDGLVVHGAPLQVCGTGGKNDGGAAFINRTG